MAIGRRKRFFGNVLTNANTGVYTAPAAPADGSAAASVRLIATNTSGSSQSMTIVAAGFIVWNTVVPALGTITLGETIDLMGGEVISGAAATSAVVTLTGFGVEAKDS